MIEKLVTMKTLKFSLASVLIAISSSVFAGNIDNCCSSNAEENNAIVATESSEMNFISDSRLKGLLQNMTSQARQKVSDQTVEMILNDMTNQVQARVRKPSNQNYF
jgi:hypothetical protein